MIQLLIHFYQVQPELNTVIFYSGCIILPRYTFFPFYSFIKLSILHPFLKQKTWLLRTKGLSSQGVRHGFLIVLFVCNLCFIELQKNILFHFIFRWEVEFSNRQEIPRGSPRNSSKTDRDETENNRV